MPQQQRCINMSFNCESMCSEHHATTSAVISDADEPLPPRSQAPFLTSQTGWNRCDL